jgi:hypothetical protein
MLTPSHFCRGALLVPRLVSGDAQALPGAPAAPGDPESAITGSVASAGGFRSWLALRGTRKAALLPRSTPRLRPTPPGTAFSCRGTGRYRRHGTPRAPESGTDTVPYL